jgi:hypothetical protein
MKNTYIFPILRVESAELTRNYDTPFDYGVSFGGGDALTIVSGTLAGVPAVQSIITFNPTLPLKIKLFCTETPATIVANLQEYRDRLFDQNGDIIIQTTDGYVNVTSSAIPTTADTTPYEVLVYFNDRIEKVSSDLLSAIPQYPFIYVNGTTYVWTGYNSLTDAVNAKYANGDSMGYILVSQNGQLGTSISPPFPLNQPVTKINVLADAKIKSSWLPGSSGYKFILEGGTLERFSGVGSSNFFYSGIEYQINGTLLDNTETTTFGFSANGYKYDVTLGVTLYIKKAIVTRTNNSNANSFIIDFLRIAGVGTEAKVDIDELIIDMLPSDNTYNAGKYIALNIIQPGAEVRIKNLIVKNANGKFTTSDAPIINIGGGGSVNLFIDNYIVEDNTLPTLKLLTMDAGPGNRVYIKNANTCEIEQNGGTLYLGNTQVILTQLGGESFCDNIYELTLSGANTKAYIDRLDGTANITQGTVKISELIAGISTNLGAEVNIDGDVITDSTFVDSTVNIYGNIKCQQISFTDCTTVIKGNYIYGDTNPRIIITNGQTDWHGNINASARVLAGQILSFSSTAATNYLNIYGDIRTSQAHVGGISIEVLKTTGSGTFRIVGDMINDTTQVLQYSPYYFKAANNEVNGDIRCNVNDTLLGAPILIESASLYHKGICRNYQAGLAPLVQFVSGGILICEDAIYVTGQTTRTVFSTSSGGTGDVIALNPIKTNLTAPITGGITKGLNTIYSRSSYINPTDLDNI